MDYKTAWNQAARADARDAILTGATAESFERTGESDASILRRYLRGQDVVLNIGCGVGRVERYLAPHVAELWAIDVSGEMIRRARARLEGLANVRLREVGNDEFLRAFDSDRFDLVFSFLVLQHLEKEDALLYMREARRVLQPGGRFVAQFPNYLSPEYTQAFLEGADVKQRSPGRVRVYTEAEVRHTLRAVGMEIMDLWIASGREGTAEIYVAAHK
jgi:SAM-dependent methyltransferase